MTEFVSAPFYSTWEVYGLLFVTDHKNPFAASNLHVENSNDDTEKVSEKNQNGDCIPRVEVGNHGRDNMDYIESVRDDDEEEVDSSVQEDSQELTVEELLECDQTFSNVLQILKCPDHAPPGVRIPN